MTPIATCLLCGKAFEGPAIAIIGHQAKQQEVYLERLSNHLQKAHPEQAQKMFALGAAFLEMIYLRNFKTTDPELTKAKDFVRWQIHQQTILKTYPDESLQRQAAELADQMQTLALENETTDKTYHELFYPMLTAAFTAIRDSLEERGKYELPVVGAPHGTTV